MRSPKNYLDFLTKKRESPEFTRRQFIFKAAQIYLCYLGFDFAGSHIYDLEVKYAYGKVSAYEAFYAPNILYYYFITGFCLANGLWKLFEIYWWGKDHVSRDVTPSINNVTNNITNHEDPNRGELIHG